MEPRENLIANPLEELLIMSSTFGEAIRAGLMEDKRLIARKISLFHELVER